MPDIVNCPQCQRKLSVPNDLYGRLVKCPTCGANFTAEAEAPAPAVAVEDRKPQLVREDDDEDDDLVRRIRRRPRREVLPHRGNLVLLLGILSLFCGVLGPIAWIMGSNDLAAMRSGRMDDEGEAMTQGGLVCGIIGTLLGLMTLCGFGFCFLGVAFEVLDNF